MNQGRDNKKLNTKKNWGINFTIIAVVLAAAIALLLNNSGDKESSIPPLHERERVTSKMIHEPIQPIRMPDHIDRKKVKLGDHLFHDVRLSVDNTISCATCHDLASAGDDGLRIAVGINGVEGSVNTPTVFNSGLQIAQFWDGRAETLEEQATIPIHNPKEMGSSWSQVVGKIGKDPAYLATFSQLYNDAITAKNIQDAIATFERSLLTVNSPFDRFLLGDKNAISSEEKEGYRLFKDYGCTSCHQGAAVGGNMFQQFGVFRDYFTDHPIENRADFGRYNITGSEEDRWKFKVPSLRLVTLTAPYFHNGRAKTLEQAVKIMGKYQLGREIPDHDVTLIIKFLETLAGEYQGKPLREFHED